jgi:hypothetical protein
MGNLVGVTMLIGLGSLPSNATLTDYCSTDMYQRADASLVTATGDWGSLLRHQKAFGSCDDGALAEGYSDAVVTLLAHRWDEFGVLVGLSSRNPDFRQWVVRHIDATASPDDLTKVLGNAAKCNSGSKAKYLCRQIGTAARDALKDSGEL